jgi:branched-chain amino acid transport system ATP-binding protein
MIFEKISELNKKGMTIFLAEQNAQKALKISSRAYVLEIGEITHEGPSENFLKDRKILEAYLGH